MVHDVSRDASRIPDVYDFLRHDFDALDARHGGVVGTSFRTFPSFPQRYIERAGRAAAVRIGRARASRSSRCARRSSRRATPRTICTSAQFLKDTSRRLIRTESSRRVTGGSARLPNSVVDSAARRGTAATSSSSSDRSTRTTPRRTRRVDELVAADRDRRRATAPRSVVEKNSEIARRELLRLRPIFPLEIVRGRRAAALMPYCANTYCVKPLQSKPLGSAPPLRYGAPRSASAVPASA